MWPLAGGGMRNEERVERSVTFSSTLLSDKAEQMRPPRTVPEKEAHRQGLHNYV